MPFSSVTTRLLFDKTLKNSNKKGSEIDQMDGKKKIRKRIREELARFTVRLVFDCKKEVVKIMLDKKLSPNQSSPTIIETSIHEWKHDETVTNARAKYFLFL